MKTLWLIFLLFPVGIYAQRSGSDEYITRIADSLFNSKVSIDINASYQQIHDSVERVMAARWVEEDIRIIGYCWPCRAKDRKEVLTHTYRHLLENKYGISPFCISSGCVNQYFFTAYDSVMNEAILVKMGRDFFKRTAGEADALEKKGAGLALPRLHDDVQVMPKLLAKLTFMDTMPVAQYVQRPEYLILDFENGKIVNAYAAVYVFYIQPSLDFMHLSAELTRIVNNYKWTGPLFNQIPANKQIVLALKTGKLSFPF